MVMVWIGGMKKKSQARKAITAVYSATCKPCRLAAATTVARKTIPIASTGVSLPPSSPAPVTAATSAVEAAQPSQGMRRRGCCLARPGECRGGHDVQRVFRGAAQQLKAQGPSEQPPPRRRGRPADDEVRRVARLRRLQHHAGHIRTGPRLDLRPKLLRQGQGGPGLQRRRGPLHVQRDPGRMKRVREALGMAHDRLPGRLGADQRQHAVAGRPGAGHAGLAHPVAHVLIHVLRRLAQRDLTQGGEVAFLEVAVQRAAGGVGAVNAAAGEPGAQLGRRHVNQLDLVGALQYAVGKRFGDAHAG